jgi:3-oxoacyl-[acyl-carrier-protein] synthase-1
MWRATGISVGEGAAFALLERAPAQLASGSLLLLGSGESSDAYHMSSPHPEGLGAAWRWRLPCAVPD